MPVRALRSTPSNGDLRLDPVPAEGFGAVERHVSPFDEYSHAVLRTVRSDAEARGEPSDQSKVLVFDGGPEPVGEVACGLRGRLRGYDRELLAAPAAEPVVGAPVGLDQSRDLYQHTVSGVVPEGVV